MMKLTFNEFESHPDGAGRKSWLYWQPVVFDRLDQGGSSPVGGQRAKFDSVPGKWRKLAVTVGPEAVEGRFEDTTLAKQSWDDLNERINNVGRLPGAMDKKGGVGIFLRLGAAYFKGVEISPLPARAR
jgi:hypothetical protein